MTQLQILAELLAERNCLDRSIAALIGRPAVQSHIGEFIASHVFGIRLMQSAAHKAIDGHFTSGPLSGSSVNVKFYGEQEGLLAIQEDVQPDYFLVLTGPRSPAASSRGKNRPCVIDHVYIFSGRTLAVSLRRRGVKFGVAASFPKEEWRAAEIYPQQTSELLLLSEEQRTALAPFGSSTGA